MPEQVQQKMPSQPWPCDRSDVNLDETVCRLMRLSAGRWKPRCASPSRLILAVGVAAPRFAPISTQAYGEFCHKRSRTRSRVMRLNLLKLVLASIVLASTPVLAAPQWVDSRCLYHANRVLPALDYREREAYRANCIANWTAGYPPPPRRSKRSKRTKCKRR